VASPIELRPRRALIVLALCLLTLTSGLGAPASAATTAQVYANGVLALLNKERAANHLPALRMNTALKSSAHAHNVAMAKRNSLSHQLPGEAFFATRIGRAGYAYRYAGENIGYSSTLNHIGSEQIQLAMYHERPPNDGHRRNILSRSYKDVGIDVVLDTAHHRLWLTEDFGSR
jgi:uncharacterized protein YkwD